VTESPPEPAAEAEWLEFEQRRARAAALGVGMAFTGGALILLTAAGTTLVAVAVFATGMFVTARMLRRSFLMEAPTVAPSSYVDPEIEGDAREPLAAAPIAPEPRRSGPVLEDLPPLTVLDDVAGALAELRREADATEALLRRLAARRAAQVSAPNR
jgi:hypothetical protein